MTLVEMQAFKGKLEIIIIPGILYLMQSLDTSG
jgi:hypothetical protein